MRGSLASLVLSLAGIACSDHHALAPPSPPTEPARPPASSEPVIAGTVIDDKTKQPVAGIEVVIAGPAGERTTMTRNDGRFWASVRAGSYRIYVRSPDVMTVAPADRVRMDGGPSAALAGAFDESLAPMVEATPTTDVELPVVAAGKLELTVLDEDHRALAHAFVRALPLADPTAERVRPVRGTDIGETDEAGRVTLVVPEGTYTIQARHAQLADFAGTEELTVEAGGRAAAIVPMTRGCIISGRVVGPDGSPANDGAIETQRGLRSSTFGPSGRIEPDGTFRWSTDNDGEVVLRAWPWRSAPSDPKTFPCANGKRFPDVVLAVPATRVPAIAGVIVDAAGAPVPFAYLDITPLDRQVIGQQERSDVGGRFGVFDMPPGQYTLVASVPGRGVGTLGVRAPRLDARMTLGGTGRIQGTTGDLVTGSFVATFTGCDKAVAVAHEPRLVQVRGGKFAIEGAPACALTWSARWHGMTVSTETVVAANAIAHVELALGAPRARTVHGTVRDRDGHPVAEARVTSVSTGQDSATVVADTAGHYSVESYAGAQIVAGHDGRIGNATVGRANVRDEQVDVVLGVRTDQ